MAEDTKTIQNFCKKLIEDRRMEEKLKTDTDDESSKSRSDLLTLFMRMKDAQGNGFSDSQLRDFVLNLIIAGRDTTAQALSWCI